MIQVGMYVEDHGYLGKHTLPGVPAEGHTLELGGTRYLIKVVEWAANQNHINVYLGRI
jgi:hypothetical protein